MKQWLVCMIWLMAVATAQAQKKGETAKKITPSTKSSGKQPAAAEQKNTAVITLTSTREYQAFADRYALRRLYIADTTLQVLNQKAAGADIRISGSGVVGMPRGSYGFAHGQLILYTTGATSSGTVTGSGSVGTGTSPGSVGTIGPGMGVNGKNPYAGPGMRGSTVFTMRDFIVSDSTERSLRLRRQ